jgi:N-methylhydantoinase B
VMFSFFGGGLGGNPETDGLNHGNNPISMATIPPAEILEAAYPILFTQWALRPDSAGAGLHRGGLGAIYEIEALSPNGADAFLLGERGRFAPFGVNGGGPAALNVFSWQTDAGEVRPPLASKVADAKIRQGQRVRLETPGGGGWGDPLAREDAIVARDVRLGYISASAARNDYRVEVTPEGELDPERTRTLRARSAA